ncbi:MAG: leucine-rich repeat domain-containing protein, partial [Candidatus Methanomethylophilaceae archaeon]|nr:leucine-rich repeat domain-containing protein [Candidatus Methanomethylophilaceae archaeon]
MIRKVIMVLALAALMSAVAVGQSADESGASSSGTCGDNLVWTLDDDGTLEISGFGNMSDYIFAGSSPWGKDVKAVVLGGEVNSIGKHAFYGCASLQSMEIPASVTSIGIGAFEGCTSLAFVYIPDSVTSIGSSAFSGCTSLNRFSGSYSGIIDGVMIVSGNVLISCAAGPEVVSVTIPSNVTSTGSSAFSGCTSLASISVDSENESFVLKDGILYSKDESKLIFVPGGISGSISVPSSVTSIDSGAFSSCISLADIAVDEGSNSYASYDGALYNKSYSTIIAIPYLKETLSFPDSTASLSFSYGITYSPNLLSIEVPSNMLLGAGLGNSSTLSNFKSLKEVEFKEGRTSIPAYALAFCSSLETVVIPSTVTEIGARAFTDCSSLQQIVIPESVTTIGGWAFAGTPMTTISLPGSVNRIVSNTGGNYNSTSVYYSAFTSSNLCEISVDSSNEHFTSIDGVLFSKDGTELVCYPSGRDTKEYSVPSSVIKIGEAAFRGAEKIEKVILNNAVTLGADSFRDCSSLDDLDTCGVKQIGSNALSGCSSLKRLDLRAAESVYDDYDYNNGIGLLLYDVDGEQHLGGGLEGYLYVDGGSGKLCRMNTCGEDVYYIIDSEGTILILGSGVMYDYVEGSSPWYDERNTISGVVVEDGVESIGAYAFYGCSSLSSVSIPEGVASIEQYAFYGCSSLLSVTIPEGVAYIGAFAFYGCSSLESVDIPEFVVSIDDGAFSGCTSLNSFGGSYPGIVNGVMLVSGGVLVSCAAGPDVMSVSIPESVRSVGSSAFRGCSSLFSVEIPSSVTSIGSSAFSGCSSLSSVEIPSSVTSIGSSAFKGCTSLSSVEIPEGVASIGDAVFQGCTSLSSVDIPGSVTTIGSFAFSGCSSLSSVDIPEGVASISFCVFRGCSSLASVSIPGSVATIGSSAFSGCPLKSVTLGSPVVRSSW